MAGFRRLCLYMPSLSADGAPRDVLPRLTDWAVRFSQLVEPAGLDALLIDITGCQPLFGDETCS